MAWIDDRVWCHPKLSDLTDEAFRVHINGIAYSSGFDTSGVLTAGQQRKIGSTAKIRKELVAAHLWDTLDGDTVQIHDWDEHNGKRDARRRADRERKRQERRKEHGTSNGTSAGQSAGHTAGASEGRTAGQAADTTADRRTLTVDGVKEEEQPRAVTSQETPRERTGFAHTPAGTNGQPSDSAIATIAAEVATSLANAEAAARRAS